jgi:dimethylhistidine N-methyltransferase
MITATSMAMAPARTFAEDFHAALRERPARISPKYFYDARGSALFELICALPEYYPTRIEMALLQQYAAEIAALAGPRAQVIEYGAGSLRKVRHLLDQLEAPHSLVPIDISEDHLLQACADLQRERPGLRINPVVADFSLPHDLPRAPPEGKRLGFFPGSSIGNFAPQEAERFLGQLAHELRGGALLIGVDLIKDPAVLHAAYNDAQGVTAAFNLNLLQRAQDELGAALNLHDFCHAAFYNAALQRIEMHLLSLCAQTVTLDGRVYTFEAGETLHTENSYKYSVTSFQALARRAGFHTGPVWRDDRAWFSLHWLYAPE